MVQILQTRVLRCFIYNMKKQLEHEIKASPLSKLYMKKIAVATKFAN